MNKFLSLLILLLLTSIGYGQTTITNTLRLRNATTLTPGNITTTMHTSARMWIDDPTFAAASAVTPSSLASILNTINTSRTLTIGGLVSGTGSFSGTLTSAIGNFTTSLTSPLASLASVASTTVSGTVGNLISVNSTTVSATTGLFTSLGIAGPITSTAVIFQTSKAITTTTGYGYFLNGVTGGTTNVGIAISNASSTGIGLQIFAAASPALDLFQVLSATGTVFARFTATGGLIIRNDVASQHFQAGPTGNPSITVDGVDPTVTVSSGLATDKITIGSYSSAASTLDVYGSIGLTSRATTTDLQITAPDAVSVLTMSAAGNYTLTLPGAATATNRLYILANIGSTNATVSGTGGESLHQGSGSITVPSGGNIQLLSNGTSWFRVGGMLPSVATLTVNGNTTLSGPVTMSNSLNLTGLFTSTGGIISTSMQLNGTLTATGNLNVSGTITGSNGMNLHVNATNPIQFGRNLTFPTFGAISLSGGLSDTSMIGFFGGGDGNFYINSSGKIILRGSGLASNSNFVITSTGVGVLTATPNSTFYVNGSFGSSTVLTTTNYTITSTDSAVCSTTSGALTFTLGAATSVTGRFHDIISSAGGTVTITSASTLIGNTTVLSTTGLLRARSLGGGGWFIH